MDAWRSFISQTYVPLETVSPNGACLLDGKVEIIALGPITLSRLDVKQCRVMTRTAAHIDERRGDVFFLEAPLRGGIEYFHCGLKSFVDGNEMILLDSDQPVMATAAAQHLSINLTIPRDIIRSHLGTPEDYCGRPIPASAGVSRLAKEFVVSLFSEADKIDDGLLPDIGQEVVDLIAIALRAQVAVPEVAKRSVRWAHLLRARRFIESHISDPELRPGTIAENLGMSVRYLSRIFELSDTSVSKWILDQRLARCHRDLTCNSFARHSITEIAYAAGFNDPGRFSRAFRDRYGITARDVRAICRQNLIRIGKVRDV